MEIRRTRVVYEKEELEKLLLSINGFYRKLVEGDPAVRELFWMIRARSFDFLLSPKVLKTVDDSISKTVSAIWEETKRESSLTSSFDVDFSFSLVHEEGDLGFKWELSGKDVGLIQGRMFDNPEFIALLILLNVPLERIMDFSLLIKKTVDLPKKLEIYIPIESDFTNLINKLTPTGALKIFKGIVEDKYRDYFIQIYAYHDFSDIVRTLAEKISFEDIKELFEKGIHRKRTYGGLALSYAGTVLEGVPEQLHLECYKNLIKTTVEKHKKLIEKWDRNSDEIYHFVSGLLPRKPDFPCFYPWVKTGKMKKIKDYKNFFEEPLKKRDVNRRKLIL